MQSRISTTPSKLPVSVKSGSHQSPRSTKDAPKKAVPQSVPKKSLLPLNVKPQMVSQIEQKAPQIKTGDTVLVQIPALNIFGLHDAVAVAETGNIELARAIFEIIANAKPTPKGILLKTYKNGKFTLSKTSTNETAEFWIKWASYEERWDNHNAVLEIFDRGDERIKYSSDREKLRAEFHLFIIRTSDKLGSSADKHQQVASALQDREDEIELGPAPSITELSELPTNKPFAVNRVKFEPTASPSRSKQRMMQTPTKLYKAPWTPIVANDSIQDLAGMLGNLNIAGSARKPLKEVAPKAQQRLGSVTVLTPVKASRKDRNALGVDEVITPVRRSTRTWKPDENDPMGPNERERDVLGKGAVSKLMEEHGYAFVPNKVLNQTIDMFWILLFLMYFFKALPADTNLARTPGQMKRANLYDRLIKKE